MNFLANFSLKTFNKIALIFQSRALIRGLFKGTAAAVEHFNVLRSLKEVETIIDVGANKGQFSLASRFILPNSKIYSFEPLEKPAKIFKSLFSYDKKVVLFRYALGAKKSSLDINISRKDDSSSILNISKNQTSIFPGTDYLRSEKIDLAPLSFFLKPKHFKNRTLMKIDVQGFELEVLKGSYDLFKYIHYIYVECSFIQLYEKQPLAYNVIKFLEDFSFYLKGIYNPYYKKDGVVIQADFLFEKK